MEELAWRKASYSGSNGGGCVEMARAPEALGKGILMRDSKDRAEGHALFFTEEEFRCFRLGLKDGEFDDLIG